MTRPMMMVNGEYVEMPEGMYEQYLIDKQPPPPPDYDAMDMAQLNAELINPGSVVRALALVIFAEINKLRVKGGDPAYTLAQFKAALKAQMR